MKNLFWIIPVIVVLAAAGVGFYVSKNLSKRTTNIPSAGNISPSDQSQEQIPRLSVVADNLEIPWALAFLPSGEIIFTERAGRVRMIDKNGSLVESPVLTL